MSIIPRTPPKAKKKLTAPKKTKPGEDLADIAIFKGGR